MARTYRGIQRVEWRAERARRREREDLRLSRVEAVALRRVRPGVILLADIPFQESDGLGPRDRKLRPALVVRQVGRRVTVLPISTKRGRNGHVPLTDGILSRPSFAHRRLVELDRIALRRVLAEPNLADHPRLEALIRTAHIVLGVRYEPARPTTARGPRPGVSTQPDHSVAA